MKPIPALMLVLLVGVWGVVFLGAERVDAQAGGIAPVQDTYTSRNNPTSNLNGQTLLLSYDNFGVFQPSDFSYLQFDLTDVSTSAANATLDLTVVSNSSSAESVTVGLYSVVNDGWDAATVTHNTAPAASSLLQTVVIEGTFTGAVQFGDSTADHPLGIFLESQRVGDGVASMMLRIESVTSPTFFQGTLSMEDVEGTFDGQNDNEPMLMVEGSPTAITLSGVGGTATAPAPFPLYLVVPFLILGLGSLFVVSRKRLSARG